MTMTRVELKAQVTAARERLIVARAAMDEARSILLDVMVDITKVDNFSQYDVTQHGKIKTERERLEKALTGVTNIGHRLSHTVRNW